MVWYQAGCAKAGLALLNINVIHYPCNSIYSYQNKALQPINKRTLPLSSNTFAFSFANQRAVHTCELSNPILAAVQEHAHGNEKAPGVTKGHLCMSGIG